MSKTKERIRDSQLRYKQGLGQNFIYDETLLEELVRLSGVGPEDDVLEIGPGSGSMTKYLCQAAHHVLSLELDERLLPMIRAFLAPYPNFELHQGDAMTVNLPQLTAGLRQPFSVVANIPYYITTPLINLLLGSGLSLKSLALMVQREVADKILAVPGEEAYGPLAVRCSTIANRSWPWSARGLFHPRAQGGQRLCAHAPAGQAAGGRGGRKDFFPRGQRRFCHAPENHGEQSVLCLPPGAGHGLRHAGGLWAGPPHSWGAAFPG